MNYSKSGNNAAELASLLRNRARTGMYDLNNPDNYKTNKKYRQYCSALHVGSAVNTALIFTRDYGCTVWGVNGNHDEQSNHLLHLSISFLLRETGDSIPLQPTNTFNWLRLMFGAAVGNVWCEPPMSLEAKRLGVWHYRVFTDGDWQPVPIVDVQGYLRSINYTPLPEMPWLEGLI